jgi:hypothetical protein
MARGLAGHCPRQVHEPGVGGADGDGEWGWWQQRRWEGVRQTRSSSRSAEGKELEGGGCQMGGG